MSRIVVTLITIMMALLTVATMVALVVEQRRGKEVERKAMEIAALSQDSAKDSEKESPGGIPPDYSRFKIIQGGDGREMVVIPAGPFLMGSGPEGDFDEQPQRAVFLEAYAMDKYEVTHADYERFARMLKRPLPVIPVFEDDLRLLTGARLPVVGVMWVDAFAYCKWAGNRLPTEAEWEKAARGEEGRTWPWGSRFDSHRANGRGEEDGYKYSAPVGQYESGRSPYGLYDMSGNVSEWVSDWYDQFYYKKAPFNNPQGPEDPDINKVVVYRGGSYNSIAHDLRASKRFGGAHPERGESSVGFRCARDFDA